MTSEKELTHEDWERAKSRADVAAIECTLAVLSGDIEEARAHAEKSKAFNEEMQRISAVLDSQESA